MKYSIIITEQNCEKYLIKCLDSIANQTYRDFEVIVIDDASKNRKDYLIKKYNQLCIRYIYLEESKGCGGARNIGMQNITGDYVCFVDSDDWWDLHYLEIADIALRKTDADIGMMGLLREYDVKMPEPIYKCKYDREYLLSGEIAFKIMTYQYDMGIKIIPAATNKLYKRTFLQKNQISFLDNISFEDLPYNFRAMRIAEKVVAIPDALYHHYRRMGSIVQSFREKNIDDIVTGFTLIRNDMVRDGVYEQYRNNYYCFFEHFYNLIVRQIFEFVPDEKNKKDLLSLSLHKMKEILIPDEFMEYMSAEILRRHIQPSITDTTIY